MLKTALAMRGGFGLPHELPNPTHSCLGVTHAPSAELWEGNQKGQGQVGGYSHLFGISVKSRPA